MLLFLYGVLLGSVAEGPLRDLLRGLEAGQAATTAGQLWALRLGERFYPALLPGAGEYRREAVPIMAADGAVAHADAYLYNRPLPLAQCR